MIITRSPMRITLGGGGTDLPFYYSEKKGFVLSMAIDKYFYSTIVPRKDKKIQIISADYQTIETIESFEEIDKCSLLLPKIVIKEFDIRKGFNLFISSEIPPGTGLGSSGSATVNLIKAFAAFKGIELTKKEIAELACHFEIDLMGASVGKQDQYIASYGGIQNLDIDYEGNVNASALKIPDELREKIENNTLLFFTGISRKASDILKEAKESKNSIENLNYIKELGQKSKEALLAGDMVSFSKTLNDHWEHKKRLSADITNEKIDSLIKTGLENGALGGKLLGAGGGGFILLYCDNEASKNKIREVMRQHNTTELDISIDSYGVKTIVNTEG